MTTNTTLYRIGLTLRLQAAEQGGGGGQGGASPPRFEGGPPPQCLTLK